MTTKKKARACGSRAARWGLRDMYFDRPKGEAGQVMASVWGSSEREFGDIVMKELEEEQRRNPSKFVNKIAPKKPPKE